LLLKETIAVDFIGKNVLIVNINRQPWPLPDVPGKCLGPQSTYEISIKLFINQEVFVISQPCPIPLDVLGEARDPLGPVQSLVSCLST
jgi:hypothetical protein